MIEPVVFRTLLLEMKSMGIISIQFTTSPEKKFNSGHHYVAVSEIVIAPIHLTESNTRSESESMLSSCEYITVYLDCSAENAPISNPTTKGERRVYSIDN